MVRALTTKRTSANSICIVYIRPEHDLPNSLHMYTTVHPYDLNLFLSSLMVSNNDESCIEYQVGGTKG